MFTTAEMANLLSHLFTNAAWANVGDAAGLLPSAADGSFYLSLHTACPGVGGSQTTSEAAYTGYTRVAVARNSGQWTVSGAQVTNAAQINWPQSSSSETQMYVGLGTAPSGAGHLVAFGPLTTEFLGFSAETDDNITVPAGAFSVDDRIAFFPTAGVALPTGLTYGTVYFVKSVSGDVITVSATSGGAVINITAAGGGICCTVTPFAVASGDIPSVSAGELVIPFA